LISQGNAATQLRCGGQCNKYFVANLLPNSTAEKMENRLTFAKVIGKRSLFDSQCSPYTPPRQKWSLELTF